MCLLRCKRHHDCTIIHGATPFAVASGVGSATATTRRAKLRQGRTIPAIFHAEGWRLVPPAMLEAATRTAAAARLRSAQVVVGSPRKSLSRGGRLLHQDISMASLGSGVSGLVGRKYSSVSPIVFMAPPEELLEGYFERPTPLLLVAGEGHAASW